MRMYSGEAGKHVLDALLAAICEAHRLGRLVPVHALQEGTRQRSRMDGPLLL